MVINKKLNCVKAFLAPVRCVLLIPALQTLDLPSLRKAFHPPNVYLDSDPKDWSPQNDMQSELL